jgi:hypothetical protein
MDESQVYDLLMSEYNNSQPYQDYTSTATASINNQTRKRVRDLLSKFSTTGMGRSGISGAAMNDIYSNAGESISSVGANAATMEAQNRQAILGKLLGLYEYEDNKTNFGDVLGFVGGNLLGSATGGFGSKLGNKLSDLL